jgi:hypothetical protein
MRFLTLSVAVGLCLMIGNPALAQPLDAQKKADEQKVKAIQALREAKDALAKEAEKNTAKENTSSFEVLIGEALKKNPDIRVAESKLREAEAELNRARLLVTQKVVALQRDITLQRAALEEANAHLDGARRVYATGAMSMQEIKSAEVNLQKIKADLARLEAELPYLLGIGGGVSATFTDGMLLLNRIPAEYYRYTLKANPPAQDSKKAPKEEERKLYDLELEHAYRALNIRQVQSNLPGGTADKIRKALDIMTPPDFTFTQTPPKDILDYLQQHAKGINIVEQIRLDKLPPVTIRLKEPVPVGAIFQFLEDTYGWRFVVREYGIVLAEPSRLPPGAVFLQDFWRNRPGQITTTSTTSSPPAKVQQK